MLVAGLTLAQAETTKQKLRYLRDIVGVSCSAEVLTVYISPGSKVALTLPAPAHVTVIKGKLDAKGDSWIYVKDEKTGKPVGWVKLLDVNCI